MSNARTNEEWLQDLSAGGDIQESALTDLRQLLLRAALFFFSRNLSDFGGMARDEILQQAEDCAQDALMALMDRLEDFRGDSQFTTWAYKFAINKALMSARRVRWKDISLDEPSFSDHGSFLDGMKHDRSPGLAPDQAAMRDEVSKAIRDVIEHDLTDNQRQVLVLIVFHEVPMDEVVRHLGTNRNAIYKMLHDARRKLRNGLQARGFETGETLALFGTKG